MYLFIFVLCFFLHQEHKADLDRLSAEAQARHMETLEREAAHEKEFSEIRSIANAKIGTEEFRALMYRLNERDAQRFGAENGTRQQ